MPLFAKILVLFFACLQLGCSQGEAPVREALLPGAMTEAEAEAGQSGRNLVTAPDQDRQPTEKDEGIPTQNRADAMAAESIQLANYAAELERLEAEILSED